jgi:putative ABC transport system permease protein
VVQGAGFHDGRNSDPLAIGIGANTAICSVVSGVLLRPLPFAEPQKLVQLDETQPRTNRGLGFNHGVVFNDLEQWRRDSRLFSGMIIYSNSAKNFQGRGDPQQVATVAAERGLFAFLGVRAMLGRTFDERDPLNVAVASYEFWQKYSDGDRSAIGRTITLDEQPFMLIGVMPEGFQFPYSLSSDVVWLPWEANADLRSHPDRRVELVVARLKSGVGMEPARQELNAMASTSQGQRVVRVRPLKDVVSARARDGLLVLLGAVGMVLLVACVNVANLLLARTTSRGREIAIRSAIGASRLRLVRQFLTESVGLAVAGGLAGLALGAFGSRLLLRIAAAQIPRAGEIGLDWRVFTFLLAACLITGIGFGLAPALAATRNCGNNLVRRSVGPALRDALMVMEVALAFVLLVGAGLLLRTFINLHRTNPGLNPENVVTLHVVLSGAQDSMAIEERVAQIPNVRAAGLISLLPLQDSGWSAGFTVSGLPDVHETELRFVTPGYFRAMGIPLQRGREFSAHDNGATPRSVVINEALARMYFPNQDPVGRETDRGIIIGVVGDVPDMALGIPAKPEMYFAGYAQIRQIGSTLVVRGYGSPERMLGAIRAAVREVRPAQALFQVATMQNVIEESLATPRLYTWLLGVFAAMGTLLALAGIYGVISYLVSQRTREFGIRMALGADSAGILRLVLSRGALVTAVGLAVGIAGAAGLTRVLRSVLYGVAPMDTGTFAAVTAILGMVALGACLIPARRAARVNPSVALRYE